MTKCPYCGEEFKNYNGLSKHIFKYKAHGCSITKEKLLCDTNYKENKEDVIMKIKNKITLL